MLKYDRVDAFFPRSYLRIKSSSLIVRYRLPRRIRHTVSYRENPIKVQSLVDASARRSRRLLNSFDELEREVISSTFKDLTFQSEVEYCRWTVDELRYTIKLAQKAQVPEINVTEEFRCARTLVDDGGKDDMKRWRFYKKNCRLRHAWGVYFCSSLDWDSDVTHSMVRMFQLPEEWTHVSYSLPLRSSSARISALELDVSSTEVWNILGGVAEGTLPNEVRIAYVSKTGETRYMTFMACQHVEHSASLGAPGIPLGETTSEDRDSDISKYGYTRAVPARDGETSRTYNEEHSSGEDQRGLMLSC